MKKLPLFFMPALFILFFLPSYSYAKNKYAEKSQQWKCLTVPAVGKKAIDCRFDEAGCSKEGVAGHRIKLTQTGLTPNKDVYVIGCIGTSTGNLLCTTGNKDADDAVYGDWEGGKLKTSAPNLKNLMSDPDIKYEFQGLYKNGTTRMEPPSPFKPVGTALTSQKEWYEWQDYTPKEMNRKWLTFQWGDPTTAAPVGKGGGNQQGTFSFNFLNTSKDCASIAWDPYGRLFDSSTLEPIDNTQITLQINKGGVFSAMTSADLLGGNLINPQQVYEDGAFSFIVPDGDYKLLPTLPYVTDLAKIDPNYKKAYSEIYAGEVIQQRGAIQHRDIAIATQNTNTTPKAISFFYDATPYGTIALDGTVSHPLTKINVKTAKVSTVHPSSKIPYRTIQTAQADKMGKFNFTVDQNKFEKTGSYTEIIAGIELVKVDLRTGTESSASSQTVALEPIPQYLEGYAYNSMGTVLPNTTVGVYLSSGVSSVAEVITDENGLFKITTDSLPSSTYNLRYTTKTGVTFVVKPSTFLAQNQQYYAQNKLSPYVGRYIGGTVAPTGDPINKVTSQNKGANIQSSEKQEDQKMTNKQIQNNQIPSQTLVLVLILVLLLGGVVGVVIYLKKKKTSI
ncbi:hypothetical protein HZC27_03455 [Candidatus Roizmanbacteria bacterium]|nr:hypothetical protein [Candidatus Roizmanbacteria bacterium]